MVNTHEVLDEMLSSDKKRGFINHLVKSYTPNNKMHQVWSKPSGDFICIISKEKLKSVNDIYGGNKEMDSIIKDIFNSNFDKNKVSDCSFGVTGTNTNTYMSYRTYFEFIDWLTKKINDKNKHIIWLVNTIKREDKTEKQAMVNIDVEPEDTLTKNRATFNLGQLESFKNLFNK